MKTIKMYAACALTGAPQSVVDTRNCLVRDLLLLKVDGVPCFLNRLDAKISLGVRENSLIEEVQLTVLPLECLWE